jgi:hypothetical protein
MKRHPALVSLSQDHHHALVIAQRLRRATDETLCEEVRLFLAHWEAGEQHFRLEEELVLPVYADHSAPQHPAILRTYVDHAEIRRDAVRLVVAPTLDVVVHLLGVRLADHIGFEEHELFPLIEDALTERELRELGARIESELAPPR